MEGPLSDIDLAIYVDNQLDLFSIRLRLLDELSRLLKDHPFDLIILNTAPLMLQYESIRQGIVLKGVEKNTL
jgi:predicted nucleotidyltransferase